MIEEYLKLIAQKYNFPKYYIPYLMSIGIAKRYDTHQYIVRQGEPTEFVYVILSGVIRSYSLKKDKELTMTFFKEGDLGGDFNGLIYNKPSEKTLETIEPTVCFCIPFCKAQQHLSPNLSFDLVVAKFMKTELLKRANLKLQIMTLNPNERFIYVKEHLPWLFDRVSDCHIANFIGITPVSFSRIKKRLK
jgi:CRP-like cAMP-binding protein